MEKGGEKNAKSRKKILTELFMTYFTGMLFSFTGGSMTWPLIQQQLADKYHLMDRETSLEYLALGQSVPGVISLNTALMIGRDVAGMAGAGAAAAGVVLPAFFGMMAIALLYTFIMRFPFIGRAIQGIRAGAIALIASNGIDLIKRGKTLFDWTIIVLAFLLMIVFNVNILWVIIGSGMMGIVMIFWNRKRTDNITEKPTNAEEMEDE